MVGRICRRRKLKVNVAKSKVMRSARDGVVGVMNIMMDGQVLEEIKVFKYLGSLVTAVAGLEADIQQRGLEGSKVLGDVKSVLKGRTMSWRVKKFLYQQVIFPTVNIWRGNLRFGGNGKSPLERV